MRSRNCCRPALLTRLLCTSLLLPLCCLAQLNKLVVPPPQPVSVQKGTTVDARISVAILPGFHVNSDKPSFDYLIPLKLTWSSGPLEAKSVRYPQSETIELGPDKLSVFSGTIDITTKFIAPKNAAAGSATMTGQLHYQACNNRECFRPMTVEVRLPVTIE